LPDVGLPLSSIAASPLPTVKITDATTQKTSPTSPLLNGKGAILSYFLSLDPALMSHPRPAKGAHGLPVAVGGSLASTVPRSTYNLLLDQFRAALEGFYSQQLPPSTPTPAPLNGIAEALGLADPPTTAPFTVVLEAVRTAQTSTLAEVLVLCPAASPAFQRLLLRRVRATAAAQTPRADDAAGAGGDGGDVARVTSGADEAGSAAGQDKDADTGDAKGGTGGPTRGPSGRFTRSPLPAMPGPTSSASAAGDTDSVPDDDVLEVAATVLAALRARLSCRPGPSPAHRA